MALTRQDSAGSRNLHAASASIAATGTNSSDPFPTGPFLQGTFQVVWAAITGTCTFELQTTVDKINWETVSGTSFTSAGAAGNHIINSAALPGTLCRITITAAAGAGTLVCSAVLKGRAR